MSLFCNDISLFHYLNKKSYINNSRNVNQFNFSSLSIFNHITLHIIGIDSEFCLEMMHLNIHDKWFSKIKSTALTLSSMQKKYNGSQDSTYVNYRQKSDIIFFTCFSHLRGS